MKSPLRTSPAYGIADVEGNTISTDSRRNTDRLAAACGGASKLLLHVHGLSIQPHLRVLAGSRCLVQGNDRDNDFA
jgi:hypothetical protein